MLTPRQRRFVDEYLIDLDGRHAAIRAGYAPSGAASTAGKVIRMPEIADAIAAAMAARSRRTGITAERVVEELARIAFLDWRRLAEWGPDGASVKDLRTLSPAETAAIASVGADDETNGRVAIAAHSKSRALDTLARILGWRSDAPAHE